MKDERIQTTVNRFAATGFVIWYVLILISLCYRSMILKQHIREYWDIGAIFFIGTFYLFIARASKGVLAQGFYKRRSLIIIGFSTVIGGLVGFLTLQFIQGREYSVVEVGLFVGLFVICFSLVMGLVVGVAYFLNRRWKRKEGIEDEK